MSGLRMLNNISSEVINMILEDEEVCKLIANNDKDYKNTPINDTSKLLYTNLFPCDFSFEKISEVKTYVVVDWLKGRFNGNKGESDLTIKVMCHKDLWNVDGGLRPFLILERIDNLFREQNKSKQKISLGKIENFTLLKLNPVNDLSGFMTVYSLSELNGR